MSNDTTIELSKTGKYAGQYEAIVDSVDSELAELNWSVIIGGRTQFAYRNKRIEGKPTFFYLHYEIMKRILGHSIPTGMVVQHIDGNGLNNRRDNLHLTTSKSRRRDKRNRPTNNKGNTSGYVGVSWSKSHKKWQAQITVNGKNIHLGRFDNPDDAHKEYLDAVDRYDNKD